MKLWLQLWQNRHDNKVTIGEEVYRNSCREARAGALDYQSKWRKLNKLLYIIRVELFDDRKKKDKIKLFPGEDKHNIIFQGRYRQIWVHLWQHRETGELDVSTDPSDSYDDSMSYLEDWHHCWEKEHDLLRTIYIRFKEEAKQLEAESYDDLMDELPNWIIERNNDAEAYRAAATLSVSQLVDLRC